MNSLPPHNTDAEKAVLGEILLASNLSYAKELKAEDFYTTSHQIIFSSMQELETRGETIDLITLIDILKNKLELDKIGGPSYISVLPNLAVSPEVMPSHIRIIKEEAIRRRIVSKISETQGKLKDEDINNFIYEMQEFYTNLSSSPVFSLPPISLSEFLKQDIPLVEYFIEGILQKEGRAMVSASMNVGKSFFLQNLALAIAMGKENFLNKFNVTQARVLYLDLEMGESALKQRLLQMSKDLGTENLYVKYEPGFDLLTKNDQRILEKWISDLRIDVLIIDPVGDAWSGDENNKQDVGKLTSYLNILKSQFKIAILISHHWKKKTKDIKRGGEMASGSYKWGAWLDQHITLEGNIDNVTVCCEKSRNSARFDPFMIKLNKETLAFEFLGDFEQEFDEETLINLFDSFQVEKVKVPELVQRAKDQKVCSENTIRRLIKESTVFEIDKSGRSHFIFRKNNDVGLFAVEKYQEEMSE